MKTLKIIALSFLAIVFSTIAYGEYYSDYDRNYFGFNEDTCLYEYGGGDIRSKSLSIMDIIDKNKNKSKENILSVLLEVELNILRSEINIRIEKEKNNIAMSKNSLYRNKNVAQCEIKDLLNCIENAEKRLQMLEGALHLAKQWKRDYCN